MGYIETSDHYGSRFERTWSFFVTDRYVVCTFWLGRSQISPVYRLSRTLESLIVETLPVASPAVRHIQRDGRMVDEDARFWLANAPRPSPMFWTDDFTGAAFAARALRWRG